MSKSKPRVKGISGLLQSQKAHKFKDTSFLWCERNPRADPITTTTTSTATATTTITATPIAEEILKISDEDESALTKTLELSWSKIGAKLQQKKMSNLKLD
ncbi:MAG: hypothetical protein HQK50_09655 [Oligoflexia bacterium]|nr:hypothetical protein [Oligoflexia bacterium]MBF0365827.1 hypothetical protein [Oligoflexia bacterium]